MAAELVLAEKKKPHSRFLFTDDNGEPLLFYMRPCAQKVTLKPLVEDGGGGMTVKVTRKCIKLAVETDQISSDGYISTKYIHDCVGSNKLLAMDKYRLKPKKSSADLSTDDIDVLDDLSPATKIQKTEALPLGRSKYSLQDDIAILKHFEKNRDLVSMCNGLKIWRDMSSIKVTEHSAESMKDRFKKRILPNIDSYNVSRNIKFLLTKNTKYLADSDYLIDEKEVSAKPATQTKNNLTLIERRDSFDQYLLDSIANSPKKGGNSPRVLKVVLKDVVSPKADKGKTSPLKGTVTIESWSANSTKESNGTTKELQSKHRSSSHCDNDGTETGDMSKQGKPSPTSQKDQSPRKPEGMSKQGKPSQTFKNVQSPGKPEDMSKQDKPSQTSQKVPSPRKPEGAGKHGGHTLRKRKLIGDVSHSKDTASQPNMGAVSTRLKKRPKTGINQPIETQSDNDSATAASEKRLQPLTRSNVTNSNDDTPDRAKRLNYVMEKFLESQDDEVAPPEQVVHDSEKVNSEEEEEEEEVEEGEIEDTISFIQDLMKRYGLTPKQVLHAFYINNGYCEDTVSWIETGLDTAGVPAWDHHDDRRLRSDDWNALETLKAKYGIKRVNERLLFLEGL